MAIGLEMLDKAPLPGAADGLIAQAVEGGVALVGASDFSGSEVSLSLAIPRRGHVLSTVAEQYGEPFREAVGVLSGSLAKKQCEAVWTCLFSSRGWQPEPISARASSEMAAWALVATWAVGVATVALRSDASLAEAEDWLFGPQVSERLTRLVSDSALKRAEATLHTRANAAAYMELLPYLLDPHGPGSRLSVRRDPSTRAAQSRKRSEGVFYTPEDVAEYMATVCLDSLSCDGVPSVLDPACGTGVFLRAALKILRCRHRAANAFTLASEFLYGTDIDPWAADAAAFVLLADTLRDVPHDISPGEAWHQLRRNIACADTLLLDPPEPKRSRNVATDATRISISRLFPRLTQGATVVIGNPPYADLGSRSELAGVKGALESLAAKAGPGAEIYLAFIEQMIRLTRGGSCAGALVLPLSIACNVGSQFTAVRKLILRTPGEWRFAFFDREPHALFGEDIKTRNAIMLWSRKRSATRTTIATGPLRKWRGNTRAAMFKALKFTVLNHDIRGGIPKIEGECQSAALTALSHRWTRLEDAVQSIERSSLNSSRSADQQTVFVGPTAYNFLNVFLAPPGGLFRNGQQLSEHPLHSIRCASPEDAVAVFSLLSSHLAYWWWHAHGDGFHVSKRFLAELPFGPEVLSTQIREKLVAAGAELWLAIRCHPVISLNRGRTSLAFTPNGHDDIRRKVDQALADVAGLDPVFVQELQRFTARSVAATLHETSRDQPTKEGA